MSADVPVRLIHRPHFDAALTDKHMSMKPYYLRLACGDQVWGRPSCITPRHIEARRKHGGKYTESRRTHFE